MELTYPNENSKVYLFFFFNLRIKSLERPRWYHPAVFIVSFDHALRTTYCWLWTPYCICLEKKWVGLLGVRFYPLTPTRLQVWKPYLHLNSHTYLASYILHLLWPISVLTKNLSKRKKVYIKLFLNRFMLMQLTFTCSKPVTSFWCFYC